MIAQLSRREQVAIALGVVAVLVTAAKISRRGFELQTSKIERR